MFVNNTNGETLTLNSSAGMKMFSTQSASHYTILSLRRPAMAPHDAVADRMMCSVRPSAILSVTILNNRRVSQSFATILYDDLS